jgi:GH43 family beta-xylosidase
MNKKSYKNPLPIKNIGDPYVLKASDQKYYMYCTSGIKGFYVWTSDDLVNWSSPVVCYTAGDRCFGNACFWAPEVYEKEGKFYLYYTAHWKKFTKESLRIGVAVADTPMGPFEDVYDNKPMFDFGYGALDASVLFTGDKQYLYYSRAGFDTLVNGKHEADIYVVELNADMITVKGEGKLILSTSQEWELESKNEQTWNEGPFVIEHDNRYYLMYSANFYASKYYGVGVAESDHPMGPFCKYEENPVLRYVEGIVSGPGHNSVVRSPDGSELICVYHTHTDPQKPSGNRQVCIDRIYFENGRLRIAGPTYTPQEYPK